MERNVDKRTKTKAVAGPGGLGCPCCCGYNTKKAAKLGHAKMVRRGNKQKMSAMTRDHNRGGDDQLA